LNALQKAVVKLQKEIAKKLEPLLPKAPEGWEASEMDAQTMATFGDGDGGMMFMRHYTRASDNSMVSITLMNSENDVKYLKENVKTLKDPEMLKTINAEPNRQTRIDAKDGWDMIIRNVKEENPYAEVEAVSDAVTLRINVSNGGEELLKEFLGKCDLKGLAETFKPPKK
jgi:hypothetical protein